MPVLVGWLDIPADYRLCVRVVVENHIVEGDISHSTVPQRRQQYDLSGMDMSSYSQRTKEITKKNKTMTISQCSNGPSIDIKNAMLLATLNQASQVVRRI